MHLFSGEQEAAEYLLAVFGVSATGETAEIASQVLEPAFTQVGGAQPVSPACRKSEESQHAWQLRWNFSTISGAAQRQRAQKRRAQWCACTWFSASQIHQNSRRNFRRSNQASRGVRASRLRNQWARQS